MAIAAAAVIVPLGVLFFVSGLVINLFQVLDLFSFAYFVMRFDLITAVELNFDVVTANGSNFIFLLFRGFFVIVRVLNLFLSATETYL